MNGGIILLLLVLLTACSDGGDSGSASFGASPSTTTSTITNPTTTTTTTTVAPVSSTTVTTRPAPATTATTSGASSERVVASPAAAGPGTRISLTGSGFTSEQWRAAGASLWLAGNGPQGCDFFAEAVHDVRVSADGRLTGSFTVPPGGDCRQSAIGGLPVVAGRYRVVYQCTACTIGDFEVSTPVGAACQNIGFTPNSDNVAGDVVAYALPCSEAEALVRKVGGPLGPINGAPTAEADGFRCLRTGQFEGRGLPSAYYACTRGTQLVTFTRT